MVQAHQRHGTDDETKREVAECTHTATDSRRQASLPCSKRSSMATAIITLPEVNAAKPQNSDRCPDLINSHTQIEVNQPGSKSMSLAWGRSQ
jgi:hypothetical protein